MSPIVQRGLEAITARTNLASGLAHPNDKEAAAEMFLRLHEAGEILLASEIESWATMKGWKPKDARELGALGEQIGMGKRPQIRSGPLRWWKEDLVARWRSEEGGT